MSPPRSFLSRFSRVASSGALIPQIDGLRFVAISWVVLLHLNSYVSVKSTQRFEVAPASTMIYRLATAGHMGVQLFFVLSGFILCLPFARARLSGAAPPPLRMYYLRRVTRLEPPYIVCMLLVFALLVASGEGSFSLWPHLASGLLYLHGAIYGTLNPVNAVTWSLEVEVQFYVLAPFLVAAIFGVRRAAWRRALLSALILGTAALTWSGRLGLTLLPQLQFFFAGFLLCDLYLTEWRDGAWTSSWWDALSIVGWPAFAVVATSGGAWERYGVPVLVLALYTAAFCGPRTKRFFSLPVVVTVGGMCYSIYLIHYTVIAVVGRLTIGSLHATHYPLALAEGALVMAPAVLVASAVYFLAVERPFMGLRVGRTRTETSR